MSDKDKLIVTIGLEQDVQDIIAPYLKDFSVLDLNSNKSFEEFIDTPPEQDIYLALCGHKIDGLLPNELGQAFHMMNQNIPLFFAVTEQESYDTIELKKNGFSECFLFPFEKGPFVESLNEIITQGIGNRVYKTVNLSDLEPEEKIAFDVFLFMPVNKKYIKYVSKDNSISEKQLQRLDSRNQQNAYIDARETKAFYDFTANRLTALAGNITISETEKKDKIKTSVKTIFSDIFSQSSDLSSLSGRTNVISNAKNIVESFIEHSDDKDIYELIKQNVGARSSIYSHETNVSVFASLFALLTDKADPADLAIAGMFHDLGKSLLPSQLQSSQYHDLTADERKLFKAYPKNTVKIIQQQGIPLSDEIINAILQHQEHWDGTGFPREVVGAKIKIEARILAIANRFDELTTNQLGKAQKLPLDALTEMKLSGHYDPEIILEIKNVFPENKQHRKAS